MNKNFVTLSNHLIFGRGVGGGWGQGGWGRGAGVGGVGLYVLPDVWRIFCGESSMWRILWQPFSTTMWLV